MPQIDDFFDRGRAIHIADRNKHKPENTLCGQQLEGGKTLFLRDEENFVNASCKTCGKLYFGGDL